MDFERNNHHGKKTKLAFAALLVFIFGVMCFVVAQMKHASLPETNPDVPPIIAIFDSIGISSIFVSFVLCLSSIFSHNFKNGKKN